MSQQIPVNFPGFTPQLAAPYYAYPPLSHLQTSLMPQGTGFPMVTMPYRPISYVSTLSNPNQMQGTTAATPVAPPYPTFLPTQQSLSYLPPLHGAMPSTQVPSYTVMPSASLGQGAPPPTYVYSQMQPPMSQPVRCFIPVTAASTMTTPAEVRNVGIQGGKSESGQAQRKGETMLVLATLKIKDNRMAETRKIAADLEDWVHANELGKGTIQYKFYSGLYGNELLCLEEYEDEAAFMRHLDSEKVQAFLKLDTIEHADVAPYFMRKHEGLNLRGNSSPEARSVEPSPANRPGSAKFH